VELVVDLLAMDQLLGVFRGGLKLMDELEVLEVDAGMKSDGDTSVYGDRVYPVECCSRRRQRQILEAR